MLGEHIELAPWPSRYPHVLIKEGRLQIYSLGERVLQRTGNRVGQRERRSWQRKRRRERLETPTHKRQAHSSRAERFARALDGVAPGHLDPGQSAERARANGKQFHRIVDHEAVGNALARLHLLEYISDLCSWQQRKAKDIRSVREIQEPAPEQQRRASQSIVASERKKLLVLIDGTWTQARHMHRWSPSLAAACKQVMFESDAASIIDALRREPEKHCTSTLEAFARALRLVEPTERAEQAASYMEGALSAVVQKQLSMVGSSAPRFVDRKKRTWNRKLFRSDGLRKQARAGDVAMVAAPDSIGRSKAVALEAVAGETDEFGHPTLWRSTHHGASRVVWRRNTREWLRGQGPPVELPPKFNIVSGLPDVSEVRPRLSAAEYEEWCVEVIRAMIELLPADHVGIFYQTPGRYSGEGGAWLDKGYLCTRGAREAGAACVWQKVVLFQDSVGRERGGTRPGFVQMLCFSKRHRGEVTGGIDMHQATLQPSLLHSHHSVYCAEQCHGTTRL